MKISTGFFIFDYKPPIPPLPMKKPYILYADDDAEDHELMEMVIKPFPEFKLISFYSGHELLNHLYSLKKDEVCIVLLDINMPELTGLETLKLIREKNHLLNLPVLMFTTSNTPAEKYVAKSLNAEILTKPNSSSQVEEVKQHIIKKAYEYLDN
jgi:CheY-like chemotaxis protein